MASYIKEGWEYLRGPVKEALILFGIATIISLIFVILAELFFEEDSFWDTILRKLSEAFTFIAAASLTGAVYVILSDHKAKARTGPQDTFKVNGDIYELKQFYVKK